MRQLVADPPPVRARVEAGLEFLRTPAAATLWAATPRLGPFQHPAWLDAWWATFAPPDARAFTWIGAAPDGSPTGFATWFLRRHAGWLRRPFVRLQPVGADWWQSDAFPGEHPDAAVPGGDPLPALVAALDATLEFDWDDLFVTFVVAGSPLAGALAAWAEKRGFLHGCFDPQATYRVVTRAGRDAYVATLSANARRAAYARRRAAEAAGLAFDASMPREAASRLPTLYRLHEARWGREGMGERPRAFLARLLAGAAPGLDARVSFLAADGEPVSASLNVRAHGVEYNLQGGFDPAWRRGVSLGKLHLGYEIDRCFAAGLEAFDLLAGRGKRADYKASLANESRGVRTVRIARSRLGRLALTARRGLDALAARGAAASPSD